jgi:hypothetical protein
LETKAFAAVCQLAAFSPDRQQGIICCVAFGRSSLRRIIPPFGSFVAPQRLASNILLVIRSFAKSSGETRNAKIGWWISIFPLFPHKNPSKSGFR